jgi:hypothetical protein
MCARKLTMVGNSALGRSERRKGSGGDQKMAERPTPQEGKHPGLLFISCLGPAIPWHMCIEFSLWLRVGVRNAVPSGEVHHVTLNPRATFREPGTGFNLIKKLEFA